MNFKIQSVVCIMIMVLSSLFTTAFARCFSGEDCLSGICIAGQCRRSSDENHTVCVVMGSRCRPEFRCCDGGSCVKTSTNEEYRCIRP